MLEKHDTSGLHPQTPDWLHAAFEVAPVAITKFCASAAKELEDSYISQLSPSGLGWTQMSTMAHLGSVPGHEHAKQMPAEKGL